MGIDGPDVKVLIAEDEALIAMDIQLMLKKMGIKNTKVAVSGEDSVRKAADFHPDLVLMDIKLRGRLNGIEAAKKICALWRIPVIYISAYCEEILLKKALEICSFGFISKPFEEIEIRSVIIKTLLNNFN